MSFQRFNELGPMFRLEFSVIRHEKIQIYMKSLVYFRISITNEQCIRTYRYCVINIAVIVHFNISADF